MDWKISKARFFRLKHSLYAIAAKIRNKMKNCVLFSAQIKSINRFIQLHFFSVVYFCLAFGEYGTNHYLVK